MSRDSYVCVCIAYIKNKYIFKLNKGHVLRRRSHDDLMTIVRPHFGKQIKAMMFLCTRLAVCAPTKLHKEKYYNWADEYIFETKKKPITNAICFNRVPDAEDYKVWLVYGTKSITTHKINAGTNKTFMNFYYLCKAVIKWKKFTHENVWLQC